MRPTSPSGWLIHRACVRPARRKPIIVPPIGSKARPARFRPSRDRSVPAFDAKARRRDLGTAAPEIDVGAFRTKASCDVCSERDSALWSMVRTVPSFTTWRPSTKTWRTARSAALNTKLRSEDRAPAACPVHRDRASPDRPWRRPPAGRDRRGQSAVAPPTVAAWNSSDSQTPRTPAPPPGPWSTPCAALGHVLRLGVGADGDVHAFADVAADILHHLAVAREDDRAMGDRRAGLRQQIEVAPRPPLNQRMVIEKEGVAQQRIAAEQPVLVHPLHRRDAMAAHHLLELGNVLREQ